MFTGIVSELGRVAELTRGDGHARLAVDCATVLEGARPGDSVSVNGVCLTITDLREGSGFAADLMGETLDRSALGGLAVGDTVNLEPALAVGGRLGGHLVQGHVDGIATVLDVVPLEGWARMRFSLSDDLRPYLVEKGSVTIDGVSLTVAAVDGEGVEVGLVPHTLAVTALGARRPGERVNVEVDVVAKYVERMLRAGVDTPYGSAHGA